MAIDVLTLGGIVFDDFSTPQAMPGGGRQAMVVHKLPGGSRVVDTLGPDEANIIWHGQFFGDHAYANALAVDGLRQGGQVVPLTWGGQFRSVIVSGFEYRVRRLPTWVLYRVICVVYQNPALGDLTPSAGAGSVDLLVGSDLNAAGAAAGLPVSSAFGTGPI